MWQDHFLEVGRVVLLCAAGRYYDKQKSTCDVHPRRQLSYLVPIINFQ